MEGLCLYSVLFFWACRACTVAFFELLEMVPDCTGVDDVNVQVGMEMWLRLEVGDCEEAWASVGEVRETRHLREFIRRIQC